MLKYGLGLTCSGEWTELGFSEYSEEPQGSVHKGESFNRLNEYYLFKKDSA